MPTAGIHHRCMEVMKFTKNEDAVSPVIGVILKVAITVILAAVIAAFVFGMAGNISKTKVVAGTAQQPDANHIVVTYQGGQDAATCVGVQWTVSDSTGNVIDSTLMGTNTALGSATALTVGYGATLSGTQGKDHVVATAYFADGSSQVILDNTI